MVKDMTLSCDRQLMEVDLPVLGICYGMQVECFTHTHAHAHTHTHTHTHTYGCVVCVLCAAIEQTAWWPGWENREPV